MRVSEADRMEQEYLILKFCIFSVKHAEDERKAAIEEEKSRMAKQKEEKEFTAKVDDIVKKRMEEYLKNGDNFEAEEQTAIKVEKIADYEAEKEVVVGAKPEPKKPWYRRFFNRSFSLLFCNFCELNL